MGQANSAPCTLSREEINNFVTISHFASYEIRALWHHFMTISAFNEKISRSQFQAAMLFKDSVLLDRIFHVFDSNDDDHISFSEYINCLSRLSSKAGVEDKIRFSFQIYDFDGDDKIGTEDLTSMLAASLREHDVVVTRAAIDEIVQKTLHDANGSTPGFINFEEYRTMVSEQPHLLSQLTMNISSIITKYSATNGISFNTPRRP